MSTKIYSAYRIKKDVDILKSLKDIKDLCITSISNNKELLKVIHVLSIAEAKKNPDYHSSKYYLERVDKDDICIFYIEDILEKYSLSNEKNLMDVKFTCSIFYDDDYWYVKFFPNIKWQYEILHNIDKLGFEDYHYQNQTDPPDDIKYEDYQLRSDKWDELTYPDDNYRNGFQYILFDAWEFRKLISKNYYTGKELYEHLAYNFKLKEDEF